MSPWRTQLFDGPGAERVEQALHVELVSAANLANVVSKLVDRGLDGNEALADLRELDLEVLPLDCSQAETVKLFAGSRAGPEALADLCELDLGVVALDRGQAERAGLLRAATRDAGLSLGDRACLALAQQKGVPVLTTDRRQAEAGSAAGINIQIIR